MSTSGHDQPKKTNKVLGMLGQRITNIKEDIADNIERRKQLYNSANNNQIHYFTRTDHSEDSLVIEKKIATPVELSQRHPSGKILSYFSTNESLFRR